MKKLYLSNRFGNTYEFTIVDTIPNGYVLWNINMIDGYLPLCNSKKVSEFEIDINTLLAMPFSQRSIIIINRARAMGLDKKSIIKLIKEMMKKENQLKERGK